MGTDDLNRELSMNEEQSTEIRERLENELEFARIMVATQALAGERMARAVERLVDAKIARAMFEATTGTAPQEETSQ